MSVGKRIAIICSLLVIAVIGVLGYIYYPAIQGLITNKKYYTQDDVQNSYDDGYKDGFETENELKEKLSYYTTMVDEYQVNIEALNLEVARITKLNQNLQVDIQVLEDTKAKNISTIAELTDSNKVKDETISSLNADIEELNTEIGTLTSEITRLETEKENLQGDINELNTQIAVLNSQLDSKNTEVRELNKTITNLENEIESNELLIKELQETNAYHTEQITSLNTQLANSSNEISALNTRIASLEKTIEDYESYISDLENTNTALAIFEFDNSVYEIKEVDENGFVSIDNPVSTENVIFNYWTVNGEQVDLSTYQVTKTTKFIADVTRNYNVIFEVDGEVVSSQLVEQNNYATAPEDPIKSKFAFVGWSIDGVSTLDIGSYLITNNTTFVPVYNNLYGLFNSDTGRLTYTWEELLHYDYLKVENNTLSAGANYKRISGELRIDDDIISIANNTFNGCSGLVKVVIPESVESVGYRSFYSCSSLKSAILPVSLKTYGEDAFSWGYGGNLALNEVLYNGTLEQWCDIDFVNKGSNPKLYSEIIKMNNQVVDGTIIIPLTLKNIKPYTFTGFNNEFIFHNEVLSIGQGAFYNSTLSMVNLPESCSNIDEDAFYGCKNISSLHLPTTLKEVKTNTFTGCTSLKSIDLSNVTTIRHDAFVRCGFKTLTLNENIEVLEYDAFDYCTNVEVLNFNIPSLADYTSVSYSAFGHDFGSPNGVVINILEKVKRLPEYFMVGIKYISELNLPVNLESVGYYSLDCKVKVVNYNCKNAVNEKSGDTVIDHLSKWDTESYFTLNIGASVEVLPNGAFSYIYYLGVVNFDENSKFTQLPIGCFQSCENLLSVTLPKGLKVLEKNCFYECEKLNNVVLPETLEKLGDYVFERCYALESITLPTTLTYIGRRCFTDCHSLTSLYIPTSVTFIDYGLLIQGMWNMPYLYMGHASEPSTFNSSWDTKDYIENNGWTIKWGYTYEQYLAETQG